MHLNQKDAELFYDLLWSLQFFVNERLGIIPQPATIQEYGELPQVEKFKVREALYCHPELIPTFVQENPHNLPAEYLAIVQEWQYFVKSDFYVERYLKNHAIFIGKQVYGVIGLTQHIEEIIPKYALPQMIHTVLLPFKDWIIYDGLFQGYNVYFGSGIKANLKEDYLKAKQQDAIITSLGYTAAVQEPAKPKKANATVDWRDDLDALNRIASKLKGGGGQPALNGQIFALVKASIDLAHAAILRPEDSDALHQSIKKTNRALNQIKKSYERMDENT